jgi:drug/metabolite transporter (DMT)-like permease
MHPLTYLSLTLTMFLWGGTFISGRMLAASVAPPSAAFLRFAIASIALLLITRLTGGRDADRLQRAVDAGKTPLPQARKEKARCGR